VIRFIPRKFKNIESSDIINFEEIVESSNISVILGEPASGKTYQLKEYAKKEFSYFIELINIEDEDEMEENISLILLDSIDEALTDYKNPKKLQSKLTKFIKNNKDKKFIITCRYLEWKEYFEEELKKLDNELKIYEIIALSKKEIDSLLTEEDRIDFWKFIDDNYLETLLKNIMIIFHLVENFRSYDNNSTYVDIYKKIVKEYITKIGEDREEDTNRSLEDLVLIASSLATYMMLNRLSSISSSNLKKVASECYTIDGKSIIADDLTAILKTALFEKRGDEFTFFHKSIQEYLTAYFFDYKKLDSKTIKKIFAHKLRFYEEFEEVIIYLTNIQAHLFDNFVDFDPFIFRRHPSLTKEQQEKLLLSILNKLTIEHSQVWGRWEFFYGTTLVKFDKLDNLTNILQENASLKEHGFYLMSLLENNYSNDLSIFMFELFETNKEDRELLKKVIRGNFIDNYDLNVLLYKFLKDNSLLEYDIHQFFISFEAELFSSLYGIKYKFKYGEERILEKTGIDFNTIVSLLDFVPPKSLKYIVPYLLKEDVKKWFNYVVEQYPNKKYNPEFMSWIVYGILKDCNSIEEFKRIAKFLQEKKIYLHFVDKKEIKLNFQLIEDIFWKVYFKTNILQNYISNAIVSFYDLSLDDIVQATKKYPIKEYVEKYIYFGQLSKSIDDFLMQDENFKEYMQKLWKEQEEQQQKWDEEIEEKLQKDNDYIFRKEQEKKFRKIYKKSKTKVSSIDDVTNIFNYLINNEHLPVDNLSDLDKKLKEELGGKYNNLVTLIGEEWGKDKYYQKIKEELCESSYYLFPSLFYLYLFHVEECSKYIKSKRDYEKLFWHIYRNSLNSIEQECFSKVIEEYFELFIDLVIEVVRLKLECSQDKKRLELDINIFINFLKKIDRFDNKSVKKIIQFLKSLDKKIFLELNTFELEQVLEFLSLDKESYNFVYSLMIEEESKCSSYLGALLKVDASKTLNDFFSNYYQIKTNKSIVVKIKEYIEQLRDKKITKSLYDNQSINQEKIKMYKCLIRTLKQTKIFSQNLFPRHIQIILKDYYEFFSKYQTPEGVYSPDIYDNMDSVINDIWKSIETKIEYISVLEELTEMKNKRLSERAKYTLTKVYEQQSKERIYPNSYYKRVFDMKDKKNESNISINVIGSENNISVGDNNTQVIENSETKKKDNWWLISLGISIFVGGAIWWQFSWFVGVGSLIITFIIMLFFNPKRRFWVMACISLSMAGINGFLNIIGIIRIPENPYINGMIKFGQNTSILVTFFFIVLAGVLFWLDYKERKI